ncbi:MAG: monovalent cation/H(+) antiporter subunit G, partial [Bacteroidota bacterium]
LGALFCLVAAVGVYRMPDLYMRMHAATKAGAFGGSLLVLAAAFHFGTVRASIMAVLIIVFFYLTAPIAAQVFGLAAYRRGVPLWKNSRVDQLREGVSVDKTHPQEIFDE